jgi:hypothetical protein
MIAKVLILYTKDPCFAIAFFLPEIRFFHFQFPDVYVIVVASGEYYAGVCPVTMGALHPG